MNSHLLVIDNDHTYTPRLIEYLRRLQLQVGWVDRALAGLAKLSATDYDVVLLGNQLCDMQHSRMVRSVRRDWPHLPMIVVGWRLTLMDKVTSFEAGADDYFDKQETLTELKWKVRHKLERQYRSVSNPVPVGELVLDSASREIRHGQVALGVRKREFDLFAALARARGKVLTRDELLMDVSDPYGDTNVSQNSIDVHVSRLRKVIRGLGLRDYIETVHGVGYRIQPQLLK